MTKKGKTPYVRDVYLAYLIKDARRTKTDEYPIIEEWMVVKEPPKEIIQWDRRKDATDPSNTAICFYCSDAEFQPILGNPKKYTDLLSNYQCIVGIDASPYDNMPLWTQKSQIGLNLGITYYYGLITRKILPNVRLGDNRTLSSLEAYPKNTLICIGTNGFVKLLDNRYFFAEQVQIIVDTLRPTGICVYGPAPDEIFAYAKLNSIPIYQYNSYTMNQNEKDRILKRGVYRER